MKELSVGKVISLLRQWRRRSVTWERKAQATASARFRADARTLAGNLRSCALEVEKVIISEILDGIKNHLPRRNNELT